MQLLKFREFSSASKAKMHRKPVIKIKKKIPLRTIVFAKEQKEKAAYVRQPFCSKYRLLTYKTNALLKMLQRNYIFFLSIIFESSDTEFSFGYGTAGGKKTIYFRLGEFWQQLGNQPHNGANSCLTIVKP